MTNRDYWIIESKRHPGDLAKAISEAKAYADGINGGSPAVSAPFATGVAGSDEDRYRVSTFYWRSGKWREVTLEGTPLRRLLKKEEAERVLAQGTETLKRVELTTREVVDLSKLINDRLHRAKVTKEKRAPTVAVLLLALSRSPDLRLSGDPDVFLSDINTRAKTVFEGASKGHLWNQIELVPPSENNEGYARALDDVVRFLHEADIVSSSPDADILGQFFENFLRYGNSSKDIGIVLTPRHICWLVAEVMETSREDLVYDPALGTGGFLIAAYNRVRAGTPAAPAARFAKDRIYGCEENGPVASLAFVNMYFRGDGKHNIRNTSCFDCHLAGASATSAKGRFKDGEDFGRREHPVVTRVMMNPPFALKQDDEKEYRFVDHALHQMQGKGLLFSVLPSSMMFAAETKWWREQLLEQHTLLAVVLFPGDLFYPVAVETVGIFLGAGVPHSDKEVLWVRLQDDGFTKWKGFRIEQSGVEYKVFLKATVEAMHDWCTKARKAVEVPGFLEFHPPDVEELVPQAYLGAPKLLKDEFKREVRRRARGYFANHWEIASEVAK